MSRPLARLERRLEALRALGDADVAAELEHVLNDGYAHVLGLERERSGVAQRITGLALRAHEPGVVEELRRHAERLATLDADLRALRAALGRAEARAPGARGGRPT